MPLPHIFSLVFFLAFVIYIFLGLYILSINTKSILNRIFFAVCLSLCIWSFCFSIANSASNYDSALFWRRISSLGWGAFHSILLHFFIILTDRSRILKNKWIYLLLYLPAALNVMVYGLDTGLVQAQYNLVHTAAGWVNIPVNNRWDWYFNQYFIIFDICGLWLLMQWGRKSTSPNKKKQAYLLIFFTATAVLIGTMTEIVVNKYMPFNVPQMAPVICLLPITAIYYSIKRYGMMGSMTKSRTTDPGRILSEDNRARLYQIMSQTFIFGGMLNFASRYFFFQAPLKSTLLFSACLFAIGMMVQVIYRIPISTDDQDTIFILLVSASIPFIILRFIEYASITVWAAPFIFVILSVVFNKQRMIFLIGVFIILSSIWIWIKVPTAAVTVDGSDHIVRIGLFILALVLSFYVNRVYINRLKENQSQINAQQMISEISADFIMISEANLDEKLNKMLERIGQYFQVDRAYLFLFSYDKKTMTNRHKWACHEINPTKDICRELPIDAFPWLMSQIMNNGGADIADVTMLPPEAGEESNQLKQHQIESLLTISLTNKSEVVGFIGLDSIRAANKWRDDHKELLKIIVKLLSDALAQVEAEKEINYMAYYDALTGLPNRTLFNNRLEQEIYLARRTEKDICVMFIDLDSFKDVNDTIGHEGGDDILKQAAIRLSECVRKHDTVARFGGDEFLIMLTNIARDNDISKIARKIMAVFDQPLKVNDQEFFISASAGIAVYPVDGEEKETLIKNADLAMSISKDNGKNQYSLCSPVMKEDVLEKMHLTNNLYRALERNELVLYYQPQVNVITQEIIGVEALIRWNHPLLGMIPPSKFIHLAEQTGLINPIGQWVLQTACRQNKEWQNLGMKPLRMAVNLSLEQFRKPNLVSIVAQVLAQTGLDPQCLELEITESTAVKEAGKIIPVLHELKELGVSIAIDDFGTEYSSLSRLKALPVDRIKIDMQFVQGIAEGNKDEAIAKIIIQLAKSLSLDVIAEGVETEPQFNFFKIQMCDEIQGFYHYKPMLPADLEAILQNRSVA